MSLSCIKGIAAELIIGSLDPFIYQTKNSLSNLGPGLKIKKEATHDARRWREGASTQHNGTPRYARIVPQERLDGVLLRRLLHAVAAALADEALDA